MVLLLGKKKISLYPFYILLAGLINTRQINRRKKKFNYIYIGAPEEYKAQGQVRQLRVMWHLREKWGRGLGPQRGGRQFTWR